MTDLPPARWGKPWFHPKVLGYGAGMPCSWEGWASLALFFATMLGWVFMGRSIAGDDERAGAAFIIAGAFLLSTVLIVVAWGRTSGGWRWRKP